MKKSFFLMMNLAIMLGGMCSTAWAQTPRMYIKPADTTKGVFFEKNWPVNTEWTHEQDTITAHRNRLFVGCDYELVIALDTSISYSTGEVWVKIQNLKPDSITTTLPDSFKVSKHSATSVETYTFSFTISSIDPEFNGNNLEIEVGNLFLSIPVYTKPEISIDYRQPTIGYAGKLDFTVKGGSPDLLYSFDGGMSWYPKTRKMTPENILDCSVLLFKEPNSCYLKEFVLNEEGTGFIDEDDEEGSGSGRINREVLMPEVSDATVNIQPGVHYVRSRRDFRFLIQPTGENADKVPVVTTDRTDISDTESIFITGPTNGMYFVRVRWIQSNIKLNVNFVTGNETIDGNNVWSSGQQLFITANAAGKAAIYNLTGALVKTVTVNAGETVGTALPQGLYIVHLNSRSYKVVVK